MKKRISVILLALCMALFLLPAQAFADDSPSVVEIDVGGGVPMVLSSDFTGITSCI